MSKMHLKMKREVIWFHTILFVDNTHYRHKYTLFLSVDGNFRLQRKNKRGDPDDVALNRGNAYFADSGDFKKYLACVKLIDDVRHYISLSSCRLTISCSWALVLICELPACKTS